MDSLLSETCEPDELSRYRSTLRVLAEVALRRGLSRRLDASDIVQETLLRAHQAWHDFSGTTEESRLAWLRSILQRTIQSAYRDQNRARRDARRDVSLENSVESSSRDLFALATNLSSPSQKALRSELLVHVSDALLDLPEDQRNVFLLRNFEGRGVQEIADQLGRTRPAVAGLLRRATTALRDALKDIEA